MFRRLGVTALGVTALVAGCNPNPFCLNCSPHGDGGNLDAVGAAGDLLPGQVEAGPPDLLGACGDAGPQTEVCNGADDDCNGVIDDVDPARLMGDPNNCGKCFKECSYPHASGLCAAAQCAMGPCQPGYYDLDKDDKNGCEYACNPTPPAACKMAKDCPLGLSCTNGLCAQQCARDADCPAKTVCDPNTHICEGEVCDGADNNCNGMVDEGFDLQNDPNNCGGCSLVCTFPNADGNCAGGACKVGTCQMGYAHIDQNAAGCEYKCPVFPPRPETCNGADDDCNGVIDDNPKDVGGACDDYCPPLAACTMNNSCKFPLSKCMGKCCGICTEGSTICAGGQKVCQMGFGPRLEVCNGVDDNCDGQVDEGFDLPNDPVNCGQCGNNCTNQVPNAIAGCTKGQCSILACKPGFAHIDPNAVGCEYKCPVYPPTVETCNGQDDDCNGVVDDNLKAPSNFCVQTNVCAGAKPVCCAAAGWLCNYPSVNPKIEVTNLQMCQGGQQGGNLVFSEMLCDGFDGNCNGMVDESFTSVGKPCAVGTGACAGVSKFICDPMNAMQVICPAGANAMNAVDELCNGIDDDCDGQIDERVPLGNLTCYNGGAHPCKGYADAMVLVGGAYVYQYEAARVDANANGVGGSNVRACSKAGALPWAPVTETGAANACAAVKDSKGVPMRLCTAPEWQAACNVGVLPPTPVWSYAANPTSYQPMVCNGADAGVGKTWATGAGASCYAKDGGGNIYDMSGNVAEWTSTTVAYMMTTYYKVRGGGFTTPGGGMSCNFDFVIETPSYQANDVGFRCCADNAP